MIFLIGLLPGPGPFTRLVLALIQHHIHKQGCIFAQIIDGTSGPSSIAAMAAKATAPAKIKTEREQVCRWLRRQRRDQQVQLRTVESAETRKGTLRIHAEKIENVQVRGKIAIHARDPHE